MIGFIGIVFLIFAGGLAGGLSYWAVPAAVMAGACMWVADRSDLDADMLGALMVLIFIFGIAYYTLTTAWDWGRSML